MMDKIKVWLSPMFLDYRTGMAAAVDQLCYENRMRTEGRPDIADYGPAATEVVEMGVPGLLRPPKIESIFTDLSIKDGHLAGLILISTSEYFGVMNVYVVLEDEQGNRLESDYAFDNPEVENHWGYVPSAPLPSGSTLVIRAMALDRLGGIGMETERVRVPEDADQWV